MRTRGILIFFQTMSNYGYLPVYPLALPSNPERLTVRGLGREEVCKHPKGLAGFFNDYMTSPLYPMMERWKYEGLVGKMPGYDYPMTKKFASMRDGWKEDYFSLPKYVDGLNAFIRDKLIVAAKWTPAQCDAYGPRFELVQSMGHSLVHFHHQPERTADGVPLPDRKGITFHTTYHTTHKLFRHGVIEAGHFTYQAFILPSFTHGVEWACHEIVKEARQTLWVLAYYLAFQPTNRELLRVAW